MGRLERQGTSPLPFLNTWGARFYPKRWRFAAYAAVALLFIFLEVQSGRVWPKGSVGYATLTSVAAFAMVWFAQAGLAFQFGSEIASVSIEEEGPMGRGLMLVVDGIIALALLGGPVLALGLTLEAWLAVLIG